MVPVKTVWAPAPLTSRAWAVPPKKGSLFSASVTSALLANSSAGLAQTPSTITSPAPQLTPGRQRPLSSSKTVPASQTSAVGTQVPEAPSSAVPTPHSAVPATQLPLLGSSVSPASHASAEMTHRPSSFRVVLGPHSTSPPEGTQTPFSSTVPAPQVVPLSLLVSLLTSLLSPVPSLLATHVPSFSVVPSPHSDPPQPTAGKVPRTSAPISRTSLNCAFI